MSKLAKLLSLCFGISGLIFAAFSLSALWRDLPYWRAFLSPFANRQTEVAVGFILVPLVLAIIFGMAWWTTLMAKAPARGWAMAASSVEILFGLSPLIWWWIRPAVGFHIVLAGPALPVLAAGIAGAVVFSRKGAASQTSERAPQPRLPGDGTSMLGDTVVQLAGAGGLVLGLIWLGRWGYARGLPQSMGLWFWVELLIAGMIAVTGHELGHVTVGRALGMRMRSFAVGPFQWRIREGRWRFKFQPSNFLAWTGGSAGLVPTKLTDSAWREVSMIAAGPAASLCLGVVALWAMLVAAQAPGAPAWQLLGLVAIISLVAFAINLVPTRPEADYSDGAHIYQLLTHGPWVDVYRAFSAAGSSLVTPLRPRDFDAETLKRAAKSVSSGDRGFLLRMFSFLHFLDCGQIPEALEALGEAETVFEQSASHLPGELLAYSVYASAFLKPDAARARHWWDLMETKKARQECTDYWLARTSILWLENQPEEARKAWEQGNARAEALPEAGEYDFERSLFLTLRRQIESASSLPSQLPSPGAVPAF